LLYERFYSEDDKTGENIWKSYIQQKALYLEYIKNSHNWIVDKQRTQSENGQNHNETLHQRGCTDGK